MSRGGICQRRKEAASARVCGMCGRGRDGGGGGRGGEGPRGGMRQRAPRTAPGASRLLTDLSGLVPHFKSRCVLSDIAVHCGMAPTKPPHCQLTGARPQVPW